MAYLDGILLALAAYGLGILSPGPNVLAVIGTAMAEGRRAGLALAAGMVSGTLVWGILTLAGLTALMAVFAGVLTLIKLAGAAYLLWLAWQAFRAAARPGGEPAAVAASGGRRLYLRGLAIQLANPKAALTWMAIMSLALRDGAPLWVGGAVVAGALAISAGGHAGYALLFSLRPVAAAYFRVRRAVQAGLGLFFCLASYKLATARL